MHADNSIVVSCTGISLSARSRFFIHLIPTCLFLFESAMRIWAIKSCSYVLVLYPWLHDNHSNGKAKHYVDHFSAD